MAEQAQLPFEARRLARRTDPATSAAAARAAKGLRGEHHEAILAALLRGGPGTAHEIAERCALSSVQVSRRLHELLAGRYVEKSGEQRPTPTGRPAEVYRLEGRQ